jgi:hypothetical protein
MTCPESDILTTYASVCGAAAPGEKTETELGLADLLEGWTEPQIEAHLLSCGDCNARVAAWRHSLARWGEVDILDRAAWSDSYFDQLQEETEATLWSDSAVSRTKVADLSAARQARQRVFMLVGSVAAILLLGLLLHSRALEQADGGTELAGQHEGLQDGEEAIEAEGRALGRSLLASLSEDNLTGSADAEGPIWSARSMLSDESGDFDYFFNDDYHEALNELSGPEADSLIERL